MEKYLSKDQFYFRICKEKVYVSSGYSVDVFPSEQFMCKIHGLNEISKCNDCELKTFSEWIDIVGFQISEGLAIKKHIIKAVESNAVEIINKYSKMESFKMITTENYSGYQIENDFIVFYYSWSLHYCKNCGISINNKNPKKCCISYQLSEYFTEICGFKKKRDIFTKPQVTLMCADNKEIKIKQKLLTKLTSEDVLKLLN